MCEGVCVCVLSVYTGLYDCLFVFLIMTSADLKAHKLLESPVRYQCTYFMYFCGFSGQVWSVFCVKGGRQLAKK